MRQNIEAALELDLAAVRAAKIELNGKAVTEESITGSECAICFTDEATPTKKRKLDTAAAGAQSCERHMTSMGGADESIFISCLNPKCDKLYHTQCAKSWLHSLPSVKRSFGTMFGKCPYCSDVLEVKEQ